MSYSAAAGQSFAPAHARPGILSLQHALLWLAGVSCAIVFIEPSPYELVTLISAVIFTATGLRFRLVFAPLLLLLFLVNLGYSICAADLMNQPEVASWIATSWRLIGTFGSSPLWVSRQAV